MPASDLTQDEIESLLHRALLVRVAFMADVPYVITLGFALLEGCLVGQTGAGHKTSFARGAARVGFQVDSSPVDGVYDWESVRGEGTITFSPPDPDVLAAIQAKFPEPPEWFVHERLTDFEAGSALTFRITPTLLHGRRAHG